MSTSNAQEFKTEIDGAYLHITTRDAAKAALLFNPEAQPSAIAAAAAARADCLRKSLDTWARSTSGEVFAWEIASALEPIAHEVDLLLEHLIGRLSEMEMAKAAGK